MHLNGINLLIRRILAVHFLSALIVASEFTDRYFNISTRYHCVFDCQNATFADCHDSSASQEHFLVYIINSDRESFNFETSNFEDIRTIGLGNVRKEFDSSNLKMFSGLETLRLLGEPVFNNNIEKMPDLYKMSKLKSVNLYNNNIGLFWNETRVREDPEFKKRIDCNQLLPNSIDALALVANEISYLPSWISNLEKLIYLNLDYNELTYIPSGVFRNMRSLEYIYLSMNRLIEIDSLVSLPTFRVLDIKMQRSRFPMRIDNFALDMSESQAKYGITQVIDLRTETAQLRFNDLALCSRENTKQAFTRKLLIMNDTHNECILKQFPGVIEIYNFKAGIFAEETRIIDFRECDQHYRHGPTCKSVAYCDERYRCFKPIETTTTDYFESSVAMTDNSATQTVDATAQNSTMELTTFEEINVEDNLKSFEVSSKSSSIETSMTEDYEVETTLQTDTDLKNKVDQLPARREETLKKKLAISKSLKINSNFITLLYFLYISVFFII